ncbi:MAG: class I SAM-dependent rRNA methyltransferase [Bacteroidia bacterium]
MKTDYPVLTLKKDRERSLILQHPWLFSGAVHKVENAKEGDIVQVRSTDQKLLGYGHYSPNSQIVVRLFQFTQEPLTIDDNFWWAKFQSAYQLRKRILNTETTNGFRLIHAEGDTLPGMVVDIYNSVASVQLRTQGAVALKALLCDFLVKEVGIEHIYLKPENRAEESETNWLHGKKATEMFLENGRKCWVNVEEGQKTGFFLDQRDNRFMVEQFAKDKKVLNAFSYTGGFSIFALAGGAKEVISVDISANATAMTNQNVLLNFGENAAHQAVTADCFAYLKEMPEDDFDLIILDPPAFSKSIHTVNQASRGYKEINLKAFKKIKKGGILFTFSCSQHISRDLFQKIIFGAAADSRRNVRILAHLSQGFDHPINIYHPEGEYLKGLMLYVE